MQTTIRIESPVVWHASPGKSPDLWVGSCEQLGIVMQATSLDELRSLAKESVQLLIEDLLEDGEVEEFLQQKGVKYSKDEGDEAEVQVPWQLVAAGQDDFQTTAA